jgi:hypothetical protein
MLSSPQQPRKYDGLLTEINKEIIQKRTHAFPLQYTMRLLRYIQGAVMIGMGSRRHTDEVQHEIEPRGSGMQSLEMCTCMSECRY